MNYWASLGSSWPLFVVTSAALLLIAGIVAALLFRVVGRLAESQSRYRLLYALRRPAWWLMMATMLLLLLPSSPLSAGARESAERALDLSLIACTAWLLVTLVENFGQTLSGRYRIDIADNLLARRIRTRMEVFHHMAVAGIVVVSIAVALMTFPNIRTLGASMLASAGLAGLVVGMAARPALSNFIAGLQIALTEPIRLEDVVIVEGEWGWIEEITATYVVVRIWDLRRMVLPLSYFIEHPFQNWTRTSAEIMGTVFIYTDYRVPVEALRQELTRILKSTPLWNGKVNGLQVTDATEHTVQLRALMDSADSGKSWDLRCWVREKLLEFIQSHYPESLPRTRAEIPSLSTNGKNPAVTLSRERVS